MSAATDLLNAKYANKPVTGGVPAKPGFFQKAGNFLGNAAKAIVSPVARLGTEAFNVGAGLYSATHGDTAGANAELDKSRNIPLLGQTKPTLTNSSKPGLTQGLDIAGQGVQLGADFAGFSGGSLGTGFTGALKTGGAFGATQGFGNALTETQGKSFGQNVGNIAGQTAIGGLTGAAAGGLIYGGSKLFTGHPIFQSSAYDVPAAIAGRETASTGAVNAVNEMNQTVGADSHALGQEFAQGAKQLTETNPELKLNLTQSQVEALNKLKEGKNFSLPDYLNNEGTSARIGGQEISLGKLGAKSQASLGAAQGETQVSLRPDQAQDLLRELNRSTYKQMADGSLQIDHSRIDLTNEIKNSAKQAFGGDNSQWSKIYSNYAKGRTVMERLDGIVNLNPKATPMDLNNQLNTIQKLGSSPEGQKLLSQAVEAYKVERGIDLTDPVGAVNHVLKAQGQLEIAQKGSYMHQFMQAIKNPNVAARRVLYASTTILGITALGATFRKEIGKFFSGQ